MIGFILEHPFLYVFINIIIAIVFVYGIKHDKKINKTYNYVSK